MKGCWQSSVWWTRPSQQLSLMLLAQECPWVACSSPFPHKTTDGRRQVEDWSTAEKYKCSPELPTCRMLTYGHPGLTGHCDESQAGKQHQPWLNSCFSPQGQPQSPAGCQLHPNTPTKAEGIALTPSGVIWKDICRRGQEISRAASRSCLWPFPWRTPACGRG